LETFSDLVHTQAAPVFGRLLGKWHLDRKFPEGIAICLKDVQAVQSAAIRGFADRTLGPLLPGLSIQTELYALYETDSHSAKPQTTNDWFDACHAAVALPYCDLFLTERGLAHRLRRLKADIQYRCQVVGTIEEALARLSSAH